MMGYSVFKGSHDGKGLKIGIVVSRFNEFISKELLDGAIDTLLRHNVSEKDIDVFEVPGAFEIPKLVSLLAKSEKYDSIIALGVIIRGDTPHFDYIAAETTKGIAQVSLNYDTPVIYGVITADTIEQAIERAGTKMGNKGREAALNAIEMANLIKELH